MPLKTFNNLTKKRQKEIINVCYEEFSKYDFDGASLSRIVKNLDIAKGSFYRYFENKKDVYKYIYQIAMEVIKKEFNKHFDDKNKDFFTAWIDFGLGSLEYEKEYPLYLCFLEKAKSDNKAIEMGLVDYRSPEMRLKRSNDIIKKHQKKGEIRTDVDIDIISLFVIHTREAMRQYYRIKYYKEKQDIGQSPYKDIGIDKWKEELKLFVNLLKSGIGKE